MMCSHSDYGKVADGFLSEEQRGEHLKILIYGAGVIGSIFGVKLSRAGHDVTVLARGKRLAEIKDKGLVLRNPNTGSEEKAAVRTVETLQPDMEFDYLFVVMQRTQINAVLDSLARNRSKNIVFVVNTCAGYEEWIQAVGMDRLMLGFPSAGGGRADGVVDCFIGRGLMRMFQTTTFGEVRGNETQRVKTLIKAFNRAGIPSVYCSDMDAWQKTHVAMVTSIANALYGHGCDNKKLAGAFQDVKTMVQGIQEGFSVLRRLGVQPTPKKLCFFQLPVGLLMVVFGLFLRTRLAEFAMARHCIAAKQEMVCLQKEFDALIEQSGVSTPNIERLRKNL
jgi:2-dehydropantoate 2-reductase